MKLVECRSCGTARMIKPLMFQEHEYPDGITCHKCWNPPKKTTSVKVGGGSKSHTSHTSSKTSTGGSSFPTTKDPNSGWEISCKYEVGDSVFINTDKYGVLLCQILDSEAWGMDHIFYTLDAKGKSLDYVEEEEMFETAEEANSAGQLVIP